MITPRRIIHLLMLFVIALSALIGRWLETPPTVNAAPAVAPSEPTALMPFGYGAAVAEHDWNSLTGLGFNWMQLYDVPAYRYPVNVLYRVGADANDLATPWEWQQALQTEVEQYGYAIDAYQIGNEVNLTQWGWEAPPNAYEYISLLCTAYYTIKAYDPTAVVVSAGLAPTGRVAGFWQGHSGHNGQIQDEREFLREFLRAGGGNCTDAIGYNPLGFSADYDAEPDVKSADPTRNCDNGFCFRGMEKIYDIMRDHGYGHEKIWATEVGWITEPADAACLNDPTWAGRAWQRVSAEKQAENLAGAFRYARANYPWLAAIFVFNLNFDSAPWYESCEQMRYYSIQSTTAAGAVQGAIQEASRFVYLPLIHE